jgi:hypothetical protein
VRRWEETGAGAANRLAAAFLEAGRTSGGHSGDGEAGVGAMAGMWRMWFPPESPPGEYNNCLSITLIINMAINQRC